MLRFSLIIILFLAASVPAADECFYSLGRKQLLRRVNNLSLVKISAEDDSNMSSSSSVTFEPLPLQFRHMAGSYQLVRSYPGESTMDLNTTEKLSVYTNTAGMMMIPRNEIIVRFRPNTSRENIAELAEQQGITSVRFDYPLPAMAQLNIPSGSTASVFTIAHAFRGFPAVVWALPNFVSAITRRNSVNDPLFGLQWHLTNDGHLATTIAGSDAKVADAWQVTMGTSHVNICVFDDSVDKNHEDLSANFVSGLNLEDWGPDPSPRIFTGMDAEEHGTACAGVAAARGNNAVGCSGAAPYSSLMGIRWGAADDAQMAAGFYWARTNGADIISCSWGVYMTDILFDAIRDAAQNGRGGRGCSVLFAAGNSDAPISVWDPARHPDVICVAASNCKDQRASYSSYGSTVSIAAPSDDMDKGLLGITTTDNTGLTGYSTDNYCYADNYTGFGGTSSATPLAAGVAALCLSVNSNLSAQNIKALLQETADKIDSANYPYAYGWNQYLGYGRINAYRAVMSAPGYTNTPAVKTLSFTGAQGRIDYSRGKFKAKLLQLQTPPAGFNGIALISLSDQPIATFNGSQSRWIWNRKGTKGKNKNPSGALMKMGGKPGKYYTIIKAKNLQFNSISNYPTLQIVLQEEGKGEIILQLDSKGKFNQ